MVLVFFPFSFLQLLAPDIRHERNVLLQCVRYVVKNNFFGLGGTLQKQKTLESEPVPTTTPGEDGANFQSGSLVGRRQSLVDANQEDITKSERVAAVNINQGKMLKCDQVYPEKVWDSMDSTVSIDQAKIRNAEEKVVKDCQNPDLSSREKVTLNIYDDEVWEGPGAIV